MKKALMSNLIESSESSEEDIQVESEDDELTEFAEKLALLTSSIHKKFGRKKFYIKPKYDSYKSSKYKGKFEKEKEMKEENKEEKKEEKSEEKEKEKSDKCFNCGKVGQIFRDCQVKRVKNYEYYAMKAQLAKAMEKGKDLKAEEEIWFEHSDDEEEEEVKVNLTQGHQDQALISKTLVEEREEEKNILKLDKTSLQTKISDLQKEIVSLKDNNLELTLQYDIVLKDRTEAYTKIKELEDLNFKQGKEACVDKDTSTSESQSADV
ncbi:hypothetical protein L6452_22228 [Arctium lappa]|uniref:Uncharacterized protein n=1 Tax=Arctium lappa TaxID=4217 RepID=A0ACB9B3I3_ARCLA|nr:hypothetical protein L6452_22228 [Arctium lappa]